MSNFKSNKFSRLYSLGLSLTKASATLAVDKIKNQSQSFVDQHTDLTLKIKATKELISTMAELKGAMMKLGQMISISEDLFLPKEISVLFKDLQKNSPPMSMDDIEKVLKLSFNKSSVELFKSFELKPIASASIGQVHKAVLPNGEVVAVKIQYPKIVEAIKHDFKNLDQIDRLIQILYPNKPNLDSLIEELKSSIIKECDYIQEMHELQFFKKSYEELFPAILIPKVYPEFTTQMVLTMEFLEGDSFEQSLNYSEEEKNFLGETLYQSFLYSLWQLHRLHTDPQNGNYLFRKDKIVMLDFGSTRKFDHEFLIDYCHLMMTLEENIPDKYFELCKKLSIFKADEDVNLMQTHFELIKKLYLPYSRPGIFAVIPINPFEHFKDFIGQVKFKGRASPRREFLLLDRATFGLYTKLMAWNSQIDWVKGKNKFRISIENEVKLKGKL